MTSLATRRWISTKNLKGNRTCTQATATRYWLTHAVSLYLGPGRSQVWLPESRRRGIPKRDRNEPMHRATNTVCGLAPLPRPRPFASRPRIPGTTKTTVTRAEPSPSRDPTFNRPNLPQAPPPPPPPPPPIIDVDLDDALRPTNALSSSPFASRRGILASMVVGTVGV